MIERLLGASIRRRGVVLAATAVLVGAGVLAFLRLPWDAFPDTTPVQVQVLAPAPSLSTTEIERRVAWPVEQALSGLPGLVEVRSVSRFGLAQVTALFEDGRDLWLCRQVVAERLATVELPPGIAVPRLGPVSSGMGEIFHYVVRGEGKSLAELRDAQDWIVRPELRSVPGVAEVVGWGGEPSWVVVTADPAALRGAGLGVDDLARALSADGTAVGGGLLGRGGESIPVRGDALWRTADDVAGTVVTARDGVPVRVRDVARVEEGTEIRRGAVTADGTGEVVLGIAFLLTGENGGTVSRALSRRLDEIRPRLPDGISVEVVHDRRELVERVLGTVRTNLFEGALLVVAVLFVFLGDLRAGLVVASAIPLSMLFAFDAMARAGIAGSLLSLGALDFGLLVDSSVILVENARRRLDEAPADRPVADVVREAAVEVRGPTLLGELVVALVYLPVLALEGVEGKLFRPMALTVVFALVGSLVVSLTVVPALAATVLRRRERPRANRAEALALRLYRPLLARALARPRGTVAAAALLVAAALGFATTLGSELVPRLSEGTIVVNTIRRSGVSLEESVRLGSRIEQALLASFPDEIERVWTRTGSADVATDPMGPELSDLFVELTDRRRWTKAASQEELVAAMEERLSGIPGMRAVFTQPIEMRLAEMTSGIRGDLAVKVVGEDFDTIARVARDVERVVRNVPGAVDVAMEPVTKRAELEVAVDRDAAARHGLSARQVLSVVEALGGIPVGERTVGERRHPVVVRLAAPGGDPAEVGRIPVAGPDGTMVALADVASIRRVESPNVVSRDWGRRRIVVQANVRDRDLGSFVAEVRETLERELPLPEGVFLRYGGAWEHLERAMRRLSLVIPVAVLLVFALLWFSYGRWLDAARVMAGVPFAAVGGIAALALRGMPFSVSAGVGFVVLSGISVLGDLVLVSTIRAQLADGVALRDAVEQAALRRLRPVLMTALVASLGFLPMMLATGPGAEVQRPLATVVVGGLLSSTLLTLVVLPVLYLAGRRNEATSPAR